LIAKLKKKEHWKLDSDEEKDIADSYECVARHIPLALGKYFCFINFGVNMVSILVKRVMEDKRVRDEEKEDNPERKKEDMGAQMDTKPKGKDGKLGRGTRNG